MMNPETPLWQLTIGEVQKMVADTVRKELERASNSVDDKEKERRYVHGLSGIAEIFGCGITKANEIRQSGKIDAAIVQVGRKMVIDVDKALECYKI